MTLNKSRPIIISVLAFLIAFISDKYIVTALGIGLSVYVLIDFIEKVGNTIPVLEVALLLMCIQWIVGPYFDYSATVHHYRYHMYVSEERYMNLVVPSVVLCSIPLYYFSSRVNYRYVIIRIENLRDDKNIGVKLLIVGFLSSALSQFPLGPFGFIFFLAATLKYIGLIYLFYKESKIKWIAFALVFSLQLIQSLRSSVFHELLLWGLLIFIFLSIKYKISFIRKVTFLSVSFLMITVLQIAKADYRKKLWYEGYQGDRLSLFLDIFSNEFNNLIAGTEETETGTQQENNAGTVNSRVNQGWIISSIMDNIPARSPYVGGETIMEAIYSSIVPRFLDETKKGGGGRYAFERLTGLKLTSNTSMGVSVIGEAYGNFGDTGTYWFMFFWGAFLGAIFVFFMRNDSSFTTLPIWLPVIFLQVIKAESDLVTMLNHLVKSTVFVFTVLYILRKVFKFSV